MAEFETYKKDDFTIYKCCYSSLEDFLDTIIEKPINKNIFSVASSIIGDYNFTQTKSFKEAWELCKFTYDNGYRDFSDKLSHVNYKLINEIKKINCYKPVGSSVNIPRYLIGVPDDMRNQEEVYERPTIRMYFQVGYSSYTTKKEIINRGILTLSLINYLENVKNYKVDFNFFELSYCDDEITNIIICLKKKDEKLKIKKCYFPIVHPSFLRRLIFRAIEIIPNLHNDWNNGYGSPMKYGEGKPFLDDEIKNAIYISTPQELGIYGDNLEEDLENFIEVINSKYHVFDNNSKQKQKRRN